VKKKRMKRRNNRERGIIFAAMLLSTLLLLISSVSGDNTMAIVTQPIELTYDFAESVIGKPVTGKIDIGEQEYDTVSIPGCDMYGAPGEPVLPFKTARILIPYGEEVQDIQVIPGEEIYLGEFYIEPGQEQEPIRFTGPVALTQPDEVIYNSDKAFPEEDYLKVSVQGMRGYQILILNLYPVKYVPKARKLSYFESMQVVVSTTASTPSELFRGVPEDRAEAAKIIDNREALSTYDSAKASNPERSPLSPMQEYDYVIITNEALLGTSGPYNFQALCDSKIADGMSATIVTTEWIYANYGGVDDQTKIRNFIIDAYNNWGTNYALLGGDGDDADKGGESGDAIIPARGFWTGLKGEECTPPNIPADMYYSCLDGTFDHNGNSIYGEPNDGLGGGEVDLFAEVYVGRAPVDSSAEVSNFVKKTLAYKSAAFLPKALMAGEYLTWVPCGGDYKDEIKEGSSNHGYTTVGFPQPPFVVDTVYDRDYPGNNWPKSELINRLNNNPNIVNHMGHANPASVMKLSNSDVDALTNNNYFFGYTQGCYVGSFDNRWYNCDYDSSDCILEHFVVDDHGAFAFIGNSRYGWGHRYSTNGASQRFDRQFWDAVFGEGITRIGMANADSKEDNVGLIGDNYIRFCYYELNLFGDPAIEIATGAGVTTTLYYPDFTDTNNPSSWRSGFVIQNPSASTANIDIELRSRNGSLLYSGSSTIPAHAASVIRPRNFVGSDCAGTAIISSDQQITGTCQINMNDRDICMSYTAFSEGSSTLYYPDFTDTNNPSSWRSGFVIQNPSASTANIDIELRSRSGTLLYSGSSTIPAHAASAIRPRNLVGSDCAGTAIISSDQQIMGTCQINRNNNDMCMSYRALLQ
jgi:hypothetical protein